MDTVIDSEHCIVISDPSSATTGHAGQESFPASRDSSSYADFKAIPPLKPLPPASDEGHATIGSIQGICGGDPIILGTRITAAHVWQLRRRLHWQTDRIVREYPHLRFSQVVDAITYVDDRPELQQDDED